MSKDINDMSTNEILAEYNSLTGQSVKRFASRAAAVKRLFKAREASGQPAADAPLVEQAKKQPKKKTVADRSAAIKHSWANPKTAKARAIKQHVRVSGEEYRSVKAAFEALKLPLSKHIAFRAELKAAGRKDFEGHTFTLVKEDA